MKTWRLVSGILSIVMFFFVSLQSCAAGLVNTISDNGEVSGSAGIIVAVMLLAGGIVSIATRKGGKGGSIAVIVLYGIGALVGITLAGSFGDLVIWGIWCLLCAGLAVVALVKGGKEAQQMYDQGYGYDQQMQYQQQYPNQQPQYPQQGQQYPQPQYPPQQPQQPMQYQQPMQHQVPTQYAQQQPTAPQPQGYGQPEEQDLFGEFSEDGGEDYNDF